ncbi:MAG: ATP-dependent helicase [Promethearchaeota archaeon]
MKKRKKDSRSKPELNSIPDSFKKNLNEEQLNAVAHFKGPALVIAGAGSGKTRVLTYRVAALIKRNVKPENIMLVTFTRKAAEEMVSRVQALTSVPRNRLIAGTFHHVGILFLRKYVKYLGFENDFSIVDRLDAQQILRRIRTRYFESKNFEKEDKKLFPRPVDLLDMYSRSMNLHLKIDEVLKKYYPIYIEFKADIEVILKNYFDEKKRMNVLDFDDILVYFLRMLRTKPVCNRIFGQVRHLLVDEYQDVNQIQADIVYEIGTRADSVMVVGDDAQAIYSFRGADIKHMLEFENMCDKKVKKYFLTTNYRSTPEILELANASIKHNKKQFPKELKAVNMNGPKPRVVPCNDQDGEAFFVCKTIIKLRDDDIPLHKQAVLFRSAMDCMRLEKELIAYKIPYEKRAGVRLYEAKHVKDLISFAFVIQNPFHEICWNRIFSLLPALGPTSAEKIIEYLMNQKQPMLAFIKMDPQVTFKGKRIQKKAFPFINKLQQLYRELIINPETQEPYPPSHFSKVRPILTKILDFYAPFLEERDRMKFKDKLAELKEIINIAEKYPSIFDFINEIAISETFVGTERTRESQHHEKPLVLSTIHQAKGLEWDHIFIIGVAESMLPNYRSMNSDEELEEERRLFYVATTRAKKDLVITYPCLKSQGGFYNQIMEQSRFLKEIENQNVFELETTHNLDITKFEDFF